jgi:hypothetical protein
LLEIISSTGLQIKTDPYTSYLSGIFPSNVKYFDKLHNLFTNLDYSENQKTFIGGTTNRAIFDFELEFLNL